MCCCHCGYVFGEIIEDTGPIFSIKACHTSGIQKHTRGRRPPELEGIGAPDEPSGVGSQEEEERGGRGGGEEDGRQEGGDRGGAHKGNPTPRPTPKPPPRPSCRCPPPLHPRCTPPRDHVASMDKSCPFTHFQVYCFLFHSQLSPNFAHTFAPGVGRWGRLRISNANHFSRISREG